MLLSIDIHDFLPIEKEVYCIVAGEEQPVKKKLVLVFDDFERCKIGVIDLLGIINTYVEDKRIKTIVIASEDNIEDEENYKTFKEKVVERTVKLDIHDDEAASWLTPNSNYDLALLHYLFQTLVQIEYQLGKSRSHWHMMDAKLAPLSVDAKTGLMLSPDETLQETHRHFSHAMAIEPLCMLRYENPQDRSVIDATVDHLVHLGSGQWVGFSFGWMALLQITRNNGKGALYELHRFAEHFLSPNGFHLNGDYKNSGVCDFHYRPFTLEADFLAAHAVQKMLLRSEKNHIEVLPACPQGWKNEPVAFQNLRAENGLLISYQRTADGKHSLTVKATQDGSWYLCNTNCWVTLQAGQTQSYQWTEESKK